MLAATFVGVPGYYEVEQVVARYGALQLFASKNVGRTNCQHTIILRGDWQLFAGNLRMRAAVRGWIRLPLGVGYSGITRFSDMKEKRGT